MLESTTAATRAAFAAAGVPPTETDPSESAARIEPATTLSDWDVERTVASPELLSVGDRVAFTKTLDDADVHRFAAVSGDMNPLHLDDEFAEKTRFDGRIVHGTLVGGLISAALARLPGVTVYFSQNLEFHNPARVGDQVTAECEIIEDFGDNQYRLTTRVVNDDYDILIDGEAVVLIDSLPEDSTYEQVQPSTGSF
ncbi:MAG: MaoC family dehydratase [Haloarcula sp.]